MVERLWAGWRSAYVAKSSPPPAVEGSLFERILTCGLEDSETFVLWRGTSCAALLNIYPYTTGHLMVLPNRAVTSRAR